MPLGIVVDPETKTATPKKFSRSLLKELYSAIGCETVESVNPTIKGKEMTVYCDEEWRFKPGGKPFIVGDKVAYEVGGKIVVFGPPRSGAETSCKLTSEEVLADCAF